MPALQAFFLTAVAALAAAQQITLTPTTIRGPGVCPVTVTATATVVQTTRQTVTSVATTTRTATVTAVATVTRTTCPGGGGCPTLTSTATACRSCLVPGCVETVAVTRPCGCATLPTTSLNLGCDVANVCNRIGCRTVYDVRTAAC